MTTLYERLRERPRTNVNRSQLAPLERAEVRVLRVTHSGNAATESRGRFDDVYYLEGDERAAARRFVEENREQLEAIDFSNPDVLQSSLPRSVYDWILHFLGERELRKYQHVVYERRRDGLEWVIDREHFEGFPSRRYSTYSGLAARIGSEISVDTLYETFDERILAGDLRDHEAVGGDPRYVLEYFYAAGPFDCEAITVDGEPAIEKRDARADPADR
ncbi:hypothetical protein [Halopiger goleimassiliensis]|uniref:hypothetical protein n=1 Tax=Halopiger goleimassiliensis TaxID=1293048 RepID=UPI0006775BE2|nr:hypothetical protein [Halopiger goleimassiliensis]